MYRPDKWLTWLERQMAEEVNAKLILQALEGNDSLLVEPHEVDQIHPSILLGLLKYWLPDKLLSEILRDELRQLPKIEKQEPIFMYFRYCLGLLKPAEINAERTHLQKMSRQSLLLRKNDEDKLYTVKLWLELLVADKEIIQDTLPALLVNHLRHYRLLEACLLIESMGQYRRCLPDTFWQEILTFLKNQQTEAGYFGYMEPFYIEKRGLREFCLLGFYCYLVIELLEKQWKLNNIAADQRNSCK